jgi:hypothetical protein
LDLLGVPPTQTSEKHGYWEKKNRQYIYIVENIKFIYTSFEEVSLPVSQRVNVVIILNEKQTNLKIKLKNIDRVIVNKVRLYSNRSTVKGHK